MQLLFSDTRFWDGPVLLPWPGVVKNTNYYVLHYSNLKFFEKFNTGRKGFEAYMCAGRDNNYDKKN